MIGMRADLDVTRRIVRLFGRTFVVTIDDQGARSIKERRPIRGTLRDETYWHKSQRLPGPRSVVRTVLAAAGARFDHLAAA